MGWARELKAWTLDLTYKGERPDFWKTVSQAKVYMRRSKH